MLLSLFVYFVPILCGITGHMKAFSNSTSGGGAGRLGGPEPSQTTYTAKEKQAILELRAFADSRNLFAGLDEYMLQDHILIRFLRAKRMNVNAAGQNIIETLNWRRENRIDSIVDENILNLPIPPYTFEGHDNEGRPVVYFTPTSYDMRKFLLAGQRDVITRLFYQVLERGYHEIRNVSLSGRRGPKGEEITQFVAVLDMTGFSMAKHFCLQCPSIFIDWFQRYENHYPDGFKYFIFINMFKSALPLVEIIRPTLSTATQRSLKFFGPAKKEWSEFLLSIIPADQLPVRYGGKKEQIP